MARNSADEGRVQGVAVSPGIAIGKAYLVDRRKVEVPRFSLVDDERVPEEMERFREAIRRSQEELREIRDRIRKSLMEEQLDILDAHIRMLQDRTLLQETLQRIKQERINAEWALSEALEKFRNILKRSDDEYLRSRAADFDFVGQRILRQLRGEFQESISQIQEEVIVVAHDLSLLTRPR